MQANCIFFLCKVSPLYRISSKHFFIKNKFSKGILAHLSEMFFLSPQDFASNQCKSLNCYHVRDANYHANFVRYHATTVAGVK